MVQTQTSAKTLVNILLKDLEREAQTTRKMLAIIPDDKFDWQPHPKSMSVRRLAGHIAELPGWVTMTLQTDGLNFADNPYENPKVDSAADVLDYFEKSLASGKAELENATDEELEPDWTLAMGDKILSVNSKADVIRMSLNQTVHHRAQLGVFLRLLNVPIPGSYGPSADDMGF